MEPNNVRAGLAGTNVPFPPCARNGRTVRLKFDFAGGNDATATEMARGECDGDARGRSSVLRRVLRDRPRDPATSSGVHRGASTVGHEHARNH